MIIDTQMVRLVEGLCEKETSNGKYPKSYPRVAYKGEKIHVKGFGYIAPERFIVLNYIPQSAMREYVHILLSEFIDKSEKEWLEKWDIVFEQEVFDTLVKDVTASILAK